MNLQKNKILTCLMASSILSGCIEVADDDDNVIIGSVPCGPEHAVAYTAPILGDDFIAAVHVAAYGDGSNIELIEGGSISHSELLATVDTDYAIAGRGGYLYYLGRDSIDTLQKFYYTSPEIGLYQTANEQGYTIRNAGQDSSPNPKMIGFINNSTAILPRYAENTAWVVNLDAQTEEEFKICELDLSAYAVQVSDDPETEADETTIYPPNMERVNINENYAAITLQRLTGYTPVEPAYVAIFDLNTWQEVDTNIDSDDLKGIKLNLKNPQSSSIHGNKLYLSSLIYADNSGGIEEVDLSTLSSNTINTESGYWGVEVTENGNIYAISYNGWKSNDLVQINGSGSTAFGGNTGKHLTTLASRNNQLWVGVGGSDSDQPNLNVYDTADNTSIDSINGLIRNPTSITFIEK